MILFFSSLLFLSSFPLIVSFLSFLSFLSKTTLSSENASTSKATSNIQEFTKAVLKNYNKEWDCKTVCFNTGLRCNRQAIELNQEYYRRNKQ